MAAIRLDALNRQQGPDRGDAPHGEAEADGVPADARFVGRATEKTENHADHAEQPEHGHRGGAVGLPESPRPIPL